MRKIKYILIILFFFSSLVPAQIIRTNSFIEHNIIASASGYKCYVSIRIPYNSLVFIKNSSGYSSGFEFSTEVSSSSTSIIRKSVHKDISVETFEETNLTNKYLQAFLEFELIEDDYLIQPYLTLKNNNITVPFEPINERIKTRKNGFVLSPIIYEEIKSDTCGNSKKLLVNYGNSIPFSSSSYSIIIPIRDTSILKVKIKIAQAEKTILENDYFVKKGKIVFKDCDSNIKIILSKEDSTNRYISLGNFTNLLQEGTARFSFNAGKDLKRDYDIDIAWVTKPRSLSDAEFAIKMLKIIEPKEKVDSLLSSSSSEYKKVLYEYWSKYNDGAKTPFNYLMAEFYNRVDEAIRRFSSLSKISGAESDRGKIFVRFGNPDSIERVYNGQNSVLEIWKYIELEQEYIFKDDSGLGNYYLIKK